MLPAEVVKASGGLLFAGYSVLLAGSLVFLVATLVRVQSLRVRGAAVLGAAVGGVPNVLYWINWFLLPVDSAFFNLVARLGSALAAPGVYIPALWGEQMLLHHSHFGKEDSLSHFGKEDSLIQWTIMNLLNTSAWSALFAAGALVVQRTRPGGGAAHPAARGSSAPRAND